MALNWKTLGKVAGHTKNLADNTAGLVGKGAASAVNAIDDIADAATNKRIDIVSDIVEGYSGTRNETGFTQQYRAKRQQNARVQREIEEGLRNADGTIRRPAPQITAEPEDVAEEMSKNGFWDGIPGWAKTAGVATAGVIAGAVLFDDDDY